MRRAGTTTRIIDKAVQILFNHEELIIPFDYKKQIWKGSKNREVIVNDHFPNNVTQRLLVENIVRRMKIEHPHVEVRVSIESTYFHIKIKDKYENHR